MSDSLQERAVVQLPVNMASKDRDILVRAGAEFGEQPEDEPELIVARLPKGWTHDSDGSAIYTYLLDEKGRRRAELFNSHGYAQLKLLTRYELHFDKELLDSTGRVVVQVLDGPLPIFTTQPRAVEKAYSAEFYQVQSDAMSEAKSWLNAHRPGWARPSMYWD